MRQPILTFVCVLSFSVGLFAQQTGAQTTPNQKPPPKEESGGPGCPEPIKISSEFREMAGDAFAKLQALEESELKGEIFYQPAQHEADVAVHKAQGRADGPCETNLATFLHIYQMETENYRLMVENMNAAKRAGLTRPDYSKKTEAQQKDISVVIRRMLAPQPKQEQPKTVPVENISKPQSTDSGKLTVQSTPANAEIFVDGAFVGNAPATLKVKAGKHTIRAILSGYKEWIRDVSVLTDSEASLLVDLKKLPK